MENKQLKPHYHCKECGRLMKTGLILSWRIDEGITIVYYCECGQLFVNYEYKDGQWIKI